MALSEYKGEEIITNILIKQGKKHYERQWMPRTVFNDPAGKSAFIIGNGPSRIGFDLYKLPQDTYGCNALYRDYTPDFLVIVDRKMYQEVVEAEYDQKNIVYTNHLCMSRYGGTSHLIPNNQMLGTGTTCMSIAVQDGHTDLICFGFDCAEDGPNFNIYKDTNGYATSDTIVHQTVWAKQIYTFMQKNESISFRFVEGNLPKAFFELDNCKSITYNELNTIIDEKENG